MLADSVLPIGLAVPTHRSKPQLTRKLATHTACAARAVSALFATHGIPDVDGSVADLFAESRTSGAFDQADEGIRTLDLRHGKATL
jgi:hypothetical protein